MRPPYAALWNLLPPGTPVHDTEAPDGRKIQVKTTQRPEGTSLDSEPDHLIVLLLSPDGAFQDIYNGPGSAPWREANSPDKKGYRFLSHGKLVRLQEQVAPDERVREAIDNST